MHNTGRSTSPAPGSAPRRRYRPAGPRLQPSRRITVYDDNGNPTGQVCTACDDALPFDAFEHDAGRVNNCEARCRLCTHEATLPKPAGYMTPGEKRRADEAYTNWLHHAPQRNTVPVAVVIRWIREGERSDTPSAEQVANRVGTTSRTIRRIFNPDTAPTHCNINLADKVATAYDRTLELAAHDPPAGIDGWAAPWHDDRYCRSCGSWFHQHTENGECFACHPVSP